MAFATGDAGLRWSKIYLTRLERFLAYAGSLSASRTTISSFAAIAIFSTFQSRFGFSKQFAI